MSDNSNADKAGFSDNSLTQNKYKLLWFVLVIVFLISGAVGHDPWWKKGETYSFGIIYHYYLTDTWLIPTNAGIPFMEKPPLYYWTAHTLCDLLGSILPLHDAARLTSVLYIIIATLFLWKTALVLFRNYPEKRSMAVITVALFLGNYGTAIFGHAMITDVALTAGTAVTVYGFALLYRLPEHWKHAGIWLGIGFGMTFLSKGLVMPVILGISWLLLLFLFPAVKNKTNMRAILLAVVVSLPFFIIWPMLLYQHSPSLFMEWFWDNNIGRFLGSSIKNLGAENKRSHFLPMLLVCSFPILPLACMEIILGRKEWQRAEYVLPLIVSLIGIIILFFSASFRTIYIMPLFPLFSLLAVQGLMRLSERFLINWNKVVRILFTLAAIGIWIIWCNLLYSPSHRPLPWLARFLNDTLPSDFVPQGWQYIAFAVAALVTSFWFVSFHIKGNSAFNTTLIFLAGAVMMWCTSHTLLLPWINETKSYRTAVHDFQEVIHHSPYPGGCVENSGLGENLAPMVEYFMGSTTPLPLSDLNNNPCPFILTAAEDLRIGAAGKQWKVVWNNKDLRLYEFMK